MDILLDPRSVESYRTFLAVKNLPAWNIRGRLATFPDEYAGRLGLSVTLPATCYTPEPWLFDYQRDITRLALSRRKFAVFADCGLGKTMIELSFVRHVRELLGPSRRILILTPPMVVPQFRAEAVRFYGDALPVEIVKAADSLTL